MSNTIASDTIASAIVASGIELRSAGEKGRGVFATRPFHRGMPVYTLDGRRLTLPKCVIGIAGLTIRIDDPLQIARNLYIDLDHISISFNHSCQPNCAVVGQSELIADEDISPGDEITFDYSLTVRPSLYSWAWHMPCRCGHAACRHKIGDLKSVPQEKVAHLFSLGHLQDHILEYVRNGHPRSSHPRNSGGAPPSTL